MKPNILLIHVDQHRYDCLGFLGNPDVKTPHIDELAASSVVYQNSYCSYPVCTPSRYSLISGTYSHQHLGWTNHSTMVPSLDTFPKALRADGYRTKAVGKMHFTPTYLDVGFSEMVLAEQNGPGRFDDDFHRYLLAKGLVDEIDLMDQEREFRDEAPPEYWQTFGAVESKLSEENHSTTWIADQAVETLQSWTEQGSCLMVGFIKPHHPFDPPEPWSAMYDPDALTLLDGWTESCLARDQAKSEGYFPNSQLSEAALRRVMAHYYATISQIDHHVGRLVSILKEKGIYDNTMIIFTSDHGDYMGYHHMILKGNYMYEPLARVPLIIKYPESFRAGTDDRLVSNVDVAPTILQQARCSSGRYMCGFDLADEQWGREYVVAEDSFGAEYMVRSRRYKLLVGRDEKDCLLFDLDTDPYELENRYSDPELQGVVREMRDQLAAWMLFETPTPAHLDEEASTIERPNVLGWDPERRHATQERVRRIYDGKE